MAADLDKTIDVIVREAVTARAQSAIIDAFGGHEKLIDALITASLNSKVKVDYREVPFLQKVCDEVLKQGVRDALNELFVELRPKIKAELKKRVMADRDSIVDALMLNLNAASGDAGRYGIHVRFDPFNKD